MTRENALAYIDRRVRVAHAGPRYVRSDDPEGLIVAITDTYIMLQDESRPGERPRAIELALIAEVECLDAASHPAAGVARGVERYVL